MEGHSASSSRNAGCVQPPSTAVTAFAASFLSSDQEAIARHFAHGVPPLAMWGGIELAPGGVAPRIAGALAWLDCRLWAQYDAGDHTFFVGEVVEALLGEPGSALAYRESTYHPVA